MLILHPDEKFPGRLSRGIQNLGFRFQCPRGWLGNINQKIEYASAKIVNRKKNVGLNLKPVISSKKSDVPRSEWLAGMRQFAASPLSQPTSQDYQRPTASGEARNNFSQFNAFTEADCPQSPYFNPSHTAKTPTKCFNYWGRHTMAQPLLKHHRTCR